MKNLGKYLQEKRNEQDISIEELVARTRIPIRFIKAIEANQIDLLPNQVTAKGFLRSYAECVGVDHALITEAFPEFQAPSESFPDDRSRNEILSHVQVERSNRLPFPRRIILAIVGLVCVLLILVGVLSKKDKTVKILSSVSPPQISAPDRPDLSGTAILSEAPPSKETPSEPDLASEDHEEVIPPESELVLSEEGSQNPPQEAKANKTEDVLVANKKPSVNEPAPVEESLQPQSDPEIKIAESSQALVDVQGEDERSSLPETVKEYVLSLEAIEASWVQVTIDGEEVREALLQPSDTVQWKANKKFRLTLGNAGGVRVKLDGRELGPFGPSGEVVHKDIVGGSGVALDESPS